MDNDIAALQIAALEATKACPPLIETTIGIDPDTGLDNGGEVECHKCHGTGRVPILDPDGEFGLRVKCYHPGVPWRTKPYTQTDPCGWCKGRDWTPISGDMSACIQAGVAAFDWYSSGYTEHDSQYWFRFFKGKDIVGEANDPLLALWITLGKGTIALLQTVEADQL